MGDFFYGLSWIIDAAMLDLRRTSLFALWCNTIVFGFFGVAFVVVPIMAAMEVQGWGEVAGALMVFLLGAAFVARIAQGWVYYFRHTRTGRMPPLEL